ncbi:MAG: hypothetical protein HYX74_09245 [Acidobacteria bacterium]|nr:hypothetical protein [Acidobacteriota bacterium]
MLRRLTRAFVLLLLLSSFLRAQELEEMVNITFVADVRLFAVMSAINAGGFDYESSGSMHPVRRAVRENLRLLDAALLQRLHDFYIAHHAAETPQREISSYTSLALLLSGPPAFEITVPMKDLPDEVRHVLGFEQILPALYEKANIAELWLEVRPEYLAEIEKYKPVVRQSVIQSQQYLRTESRVTLDRQIVFIPDLMSAHGISNSRIVKNLYYLIVGPAEDPERNLRNVRHEYLHFLLDPVIEKNGLAIIQQQEVLQLLASRPELMEKFSKDLKLLNTESMIEAVQLRIERPQDAAAHLARQYAAGNVLVYHYYEQLEDFEKSTSTFPEYFPSIIQAFNLKQEMERRDRLAEENEKLRQQREQRAEQSRLQSERMETLQRINALLQEKKFEEAEKLLLALKEEDPADPNILFNLGQIEMQRENLAGAENYFKGVATHPQAPAWLAARGKVQLATVYLMADRLAEARELLRQVAQSSGDDLRGSREEAIRRLAALPADR